MTSSRVFHRIASNRLSDEAVRQIQSLIEKGIFKPGDKLPSERELIRELAVSRTSIREALRILEGLGEIAVRPGLGAFVLDNSRNDLTTIWRTRLLEHQKEFIDLLEVREALETKAATLAAARITDDELVTIAEALAKMQESANTNNVQLAVDADIEFHDRISRASQNGFLIQLSDSISHAVIESRYGYFQRPHQIVTSLRQHYCVYEALQKRDPEAAAAAMREHVRNSIQVLQEIT